MVFTFDGWDGTSLAASLAPETQAFLRQYGLHLGLSGPAGQRGESGGEFSALVPLGDTRCDDCTQNLQASACVVLRDREPRRSSTTIEVLLTSDSTFFKLLVLDMSGLDALQTKEIDELNNIIFGLGQGVSHAAGPSNQKGKTDLYPWREIFWLYTEADIFFSTNEQSHSSHNSVVAQAHLQAFLAKLGNMNLAKQLKKAESRRLLNEFIGINVTLIKNLKFQELNMTAMMKILKSESTSQAG